ncbi:MAG: AMP-binding protein [Weeksellaceae bacterium]|nr:AMP-binding protein [Weeksellaceae bacterium]
MIILDFSTQQLDALNPKIFWEKSILDFLNEWNSNHDYIIAHTSGSTGKPKEIRLSKKSMKLSAKLTGEFFNLQKGNTALLCMPVNFIAGKMMIVRAIELGLKLFCVEAKSQIDLEKFPSLDFVPMTPMQVEKSFDSIQKIKTLLIGGAPLSDDLRTKLIQTKVKVYESYGMTETITHIGLKEISEEFFTVLNQVKIKKDDRNCLVIKTPYFEEEVVTNDLVEITDEKYFKWLGRFDNVINSGGIKLIPEQIEEKLKPYIQKEFIVSSKPDAILGEKLILIIESDTFDFSLPDGLLGKFEKPKEILFIKEFPRTESGKIKRNFKTIS